MTVKEDYTFRKDDKHTECHVCGISSCDHFHKKGTLPKEFVSLREEEPVEIAVDPALEGSDETVFSVHMKFGSQFQSEVYLQSLKNTRNLQIHPYFHHVIFQRLQNLTILLRVGCLLNRLQNSFQRL